MMLLVGMVATAQPTSKAIPAPQRFNMRLESRHGETFSVFVDGNLQNKMPQSRVMINDVSDQRHEVIVVQKRPVEKAAMIEIVPGEPTVVIYVDYDSRLEQLSLYTPSHNRYESKPEVAEQYMRKPNPRHGETPQQPDTREYTKPQQKTATVDTGQLNTMALHMQAQAFDSDRLALGKTIVASARFTASQIAYLARTIDYSQSQVEFLKYAYAYCVDKENYYTVTDVLTYSSDKKKIIDFLATQR